MTALQIRPMTAADAAPVAALYRAGGWGGREAYTRWVMTVPSCRMLVGVAEGRVVATGLATINGPVGWVGSIFVDAEMRSRGYGRLMTEAACELIDAAGCRTQALIASEFGKPLYDRMGFRVSTWYHQLRAEHLAMLPSPPEGARVRNLEPSDLPAVFELDRLATGEDRRQPLTALAGMDWGGAWILERDGSGGPAGYLLLGERAYGPVIAPRLEDGLFLLDLHRALVPEGATVRAGIPHEHEAAWRELQRRGWRETWRAPRMLLGPDIEWRPEWIWGQISSAMG